MKLSHLSSMAGLLTCLMASAPVLALSTDTEQPIYIDSDSQQLDMQSNQVTFAGDVKLKQGSINISADKIVVTRDPVDGAIKQIEAYGQPSTFSQLTDDGNTLAGEAEELYYNMAADELLMLRRATLAQDGSKISGDKIRYKISEQKLVADGAQTGGRVSTVLQPPAKSE